EGDETFGLVVTEANDITTNGETGVTGEATITDGGNGPGDNPDNDKPTLSISDPVIVNEGDDAEFTVSLSNPTEADVVINIVP
ncbi:hypothetical protein, partial [Vibrio sp. 10N.286.49.B3]|uniref:hypothetical protein n=2 Tax=Vibrio sp. 10N.286.49.B3 TaxID=1880855 RepID=UPI0018E445B9